MQTYRFVFSLSSPTPDSKYPQFSPTDGRSIFGILPSHTPQPHLHDDGTPWFTQQRGKEATPALQTHKATHHFSRDWRYGPISVDWFDFTERKKRKGKKAAVPKPNPPSMSQSSAPPVNGQAESNRDARKFSQIYVSSQIEVIAIRAKHDCRIILVSRYRGNNVWHCKLTARNHTNISGYIR